MARLIEAFSQLLDGSGDPLVSGTIDFFESGSSSVRKDTFSDSGETTVNANPLVLNGDGRVPDVFGTGAYRAILKTAAGVQILQRDPVGGDATLSFGSDWASTTTYAATDVVREGGFYWESLVGANLNQRPSLDAGANWAKIDFTPFGTDWLAARTYEKTDVVRLAGIYYLSLVSSNINFSPDSNPTKWEKLDVALQWDTSATYSIGEIVEGSNGKSYRSITGANQGNDPVSSTANWEEIKFQRVWNSAITYAANDNVFGSDGKHYRSLAGSNINNDPTSDTVNWGPAFTDAPTQSAGNSTTLLATTAFVTDAVTPGTSFIAGLIPSNAADADHDITISSGKARDSTDAKNLVLSSAITKQIDAAWAEGSNLGGLFSGTVAADTTYHLFIIEKDSDGTIDAGFDTSVTATNIPAGWTAFRRVFSILTDASSNILAFDAFETEGGLFVDLESKVPDISTGSLGTTANLQVMTVPVDIQVLVHFSSVVAQSVTSQNIIFTSIHQADQVPVIANSDLSTSTGSSRDTGNISRITDTLGRIRFRADVSAVSSFDLRTIGWTDYRR